MKKMLERFRKAPVLYLIGIMVFIIAITGIKGLFFAKGAEVGVKPGRIGTLTIEEKLEDFEYASSLLEDNYPYFDVKKRMFQYDWREHKDEFRQWIKETNNDAEFYNTMNRIFTLLQNGHTHIVSPDFYSELSDLYKRVPGGTWEKVILNKRVNKHYQYWGQTLDYKVNFIPIVFKYIEGKYIAISNLSSDDVLKINKVPAGSILKKVGTKDVDEYISELMDKQLLQYDYNRHKFKVNNLIIYLEDNQPMKLTFETPEGKTVEGEFEGIGYSEIYTEENEIENVNFNASIIENNKVGYLKINSFDQKSIEKDKQGISDFLYSIKDYPYLIIDIRGNPGGAMEYWTDNIMSRLTEQELTRDYYVGFKLGKYTMSHLEEVLFYSGQPSYNKLPYNKNYPPEVAETLNLFIKENITVGPDIPVGFKGKIFLLVDNNVYSSAETFAAFARDSKWATLVGTTTGGDGMGYDPAYAALPNSGLVMRFSFAMGLNSDGAANEELHTSPDVYVEQSYEDFLRYVRDESGKGNSLEYDTILKKAIELSNQ